MAPVVFYLKIDLVKMNCQGILSAAVYQPSLHGFGSAVPFFTA